MMKGSLTKLMGSSAIEFVFCLNRLFWECIKQGSNPKQVCSPHQWFFFPACGCYMIYVIRLHMALHEPVKTSINKEKRMSDIIFWIIKVKLISNHLILSRFWNKIRQNIFTFNKSLFLYFLGLTYLYKLHWKSKFFNFQKMFMMNLKMENLCKPPQN